jgi:hypothetical protein
MTQKSFSSLPRRKFLALCAAVPAVARFVTGVRLSLGRELPPAEFLLSFQSLPEADLAREVESLLRCVDPTVVHRYQPIDPNANAWSLWKQAGQAYVEQPRDDAFDADLESFSNRPESLTSEARNRITTWIEQNEACRKLIDQGIACGGFESPQAAMSVLLDYSMDDRMMMRSLASAKATQAQACLNRRDFAAALDESFDVLKIAEMLVRSECMNVDYLIAQCIQGIGIHSTYQVATSPGVSNHLACMAIDRLASAKIGVELCNQSHRVEFCRYVVPWIAAFPVAAGPTELAKCFVLGPFGAATERSSEIETEYRRSIRQTAILIEGHPHPFDKEATVRTASSLVAQVIEDSYQPNSKRVQDDLKSLGQELAAWPADVSPDTWLLAGMKYGEPGDPKRPRKPTDRELRRAQRKLRSIDNVLGKMLLASHVSFTPAWISSVNQARLEAARLRIALRLYQKQFGRLPESLVELVQSGFLPGVPADPYDGNRFRYSPERCTIWCVGQHGNNDGVIPENSEETGFFEDIEMTWRIAPPAAT